MAFKSSTNQEFDHVESNEISKRSNKQDFLKRFYHNKVPVIRNGRK